MELLSPNFSLAELTVSDTAARKGINNAPTAEIKNRMILLANKLELVRKLVGKPVNITSGYRCPELNKLIGGVANSAHVDGYAADINVNGYTPKQLAEKIRDSGITYDQLILEYDTWVHIAVGPTPIRQQDLTIRKGSGYQKGIV